MPTKTLLTQRCREHAHPEFAIEFDPGRLLAADAEWLAQVLESWVINGRRLAAGETVQIGWSFLQLKQQGEALGFLEPEFGSMPIKWVPGVTATLGQLRQHKDTVASVLPAESMDIPSLRQGCIVCTRVQASQGFLMSRATPEEDDSGWFIGCLDEDHDHQDMDSLELMSLYQAIAERASRALPYLGLPAGCSVKVQGSEPLIQGQDGPLPIKPGSYLDALMRKGVART
ncbi:hypothetical protein [Solimonas sp. SE-A11]|uniref:immunity protein Imm33 domain-containing protein n=1 Tax=Solimonas sp. SE-A11 TaxID=3054954 RepID=UPI00259D02D9|nr:hypothetical protein [Solimonas sp. SE-A11]MDM4770628.1 hypothetical protein [Solimonas sp. SE-A11]